MTTRAIEYAAGPGAGPDAGRRLRESLEASAKSVREARTPDMRAFHLAGLRTRAGIAREMGVDVPADVEALLTSPTTARSSSSTSSAPSRSSSPAGSAWIAAAAERLRRAETS